MDLEQIKSDPYILALLKMSDRQIEVMGYTEHGLRHANVTSDYAIKICRSLGLNDYETETASIATYLHDIGNLTGRENHGQTGAVLVGQFLLSYGAKPDQLAEILTAMKVIMAATRSSPEWAASERIHNLFVSRPTTSLRTVRKIAPKTETIATRCFSLFAIILSDQSPVTYINRPLYSKAPPLHSLWA